MTEPKTTNWNEAIDAAIKQNELRQIMYSAEFDDEASLHAELQSCKEAISGLKERSNSPNVHFDFEGAA